ncbi:MAG: TrkA family potassium uptake protein [Clostridiales bacterium]|nr:TrkA family potassium uptake protein [Clostridiales bacterium]
MAVKKVSPLKKQYVIFGLGRFGVSLTKALNEYGAEVLAIDADEEKINEISDYCTHAVCCDATDEHNLEKLGINNMDVAIVCLASNIEASIYISLMCKQMGIPKTIAKARDERHKLVLQRIGVDAVIIPEEAMGEKLAATLLKPNMVEIMTLADKFRMIEIRTPKKWQDKTLAELDLRNTEHVTLVVIKRGDDVIASPGGDCKLLAEDLLIIAGTVSDTKRLSSKATETVINDLEDLI